MRWSNRLDFAVEGHDRIDHVAQCSHLCRLRRELGQMSGYDNPQRNDHCCCKPFWALVFLGVPGGLEEELSAVVVLQLSCSPPCLTVKCLPQSACHALDTDCT